MNSSQVRIALVGGGFSLHTQLPAFRRVAGAEVTDLVGRDPERTRSQARKYAIPRATVDLGEVLQRADVDLVCVTTPPDLHRKMSVAVLDAGKHVLCEKPMALSVAEATAMCHAAQRADRLALIDHQLRFAPGIVKLRRFLADGFLGKPLHVELVLRVDSRLDPKRPFDWWSETQRGGGVLGALGSHVIDLLRWLFGEVRAVCGAQRTFVDSRTPAGELRPRPVDADEYACFWLTLGTATLVFANVAVSVVAHRGAGLRLEVYGSDGMLRLDDDGALFGCRRDLATRPALEQPVLEDLSEAEDLSTEDLRRIPDNLFGRAFLLQARALVAAVRNRQTHLPNAATFEDGLAVQSVLDALRHSWSTRSWVQMPPKGLEAPGPPLRGI